MKKSPLPIEPQEIILETLEARIAPASATFTDADGDIVTVWTSKGTAQNIMDVVTGGANSEIEKIDLGANAVFKGTNIKVSVTSKVAGGDGLANVWWIASGNQDLGNVEVAGDLAKLTAGDANYINGSVKNVKAQTVGVNGGAADKVWSLLGGTTSVNIAGNVLGAALVWNNPDANGKVTVGSLTIGGDLVGVAADSTGLVEVKTGAGGTAEIKTLTIGGSLIGTNGVKTGAVIVGNTASPDDHFGKIGKTTIGGSLDGFTKMYSGTLYASTSIGQTSVAGSLKGDDGMASGSIFAYGQITGPVFVGGSLEGSTGAQSGSVYSTFGITKAVTVGGSLSGAGGLYSGSVASASGAINNVTVIGGIDGGGGKYSGSIAGWGIGDVAIGGTVFGDSGEYAGSIISYFANAMTRFDIGDVTIGGALQGGSNSHSGQIFGLSAGDISITSNLEAGTAAGTGSIDLAGAFNSLSIGGDIVGGAMNATGSVSAQGAGAKITSVTIGGSLIGANGQFSGGIDIAGSIGTLSIGGSVLGGQGADSASISVDGTISKLEIGGNIIGNETAGANSGSLNLADVTTGKIGGSITGGKAVNSGSINLVKSTMFTIGGGLTGGEGVESGSLQFSVIGTLSVGTTAINGSSVYGGSATGAGIVFGTVGKASFSGNITGGSVVNAGFVQFYSASSVSIGGSIVGGAADGTGYLFVNGPASGKITVGGDVIGSDDLSETGVIKVGGAKAIEVKGSVLGADATMAGKKNSGYIISTGVVDSLTIGKDIVGGDLFNSTNVNMGGVKAKSIGTMLVKGNITGHNNEYVTIAANGDITKTSGTNLAIKSLTVNGSVSYANILGGYTADGTTLDGNGGNDGGSAQLGTIIVLGDFKNSSIATGVNNNNAMINHWADGNNELLAKPTGSNIVASIAKIVIKGASFASVQNGFAAEQVKSLNIGGFNIPVPAGAQNFQVSGGNYKVQQVVA